MKYVLKFQLLLLKGLVGRGTITSGIIHLNFSWVLFVPSLIIPPLWVCSRLVILFTDELGHISHWRAIMAGSLAGMVATVVTYPTDVIKTRLIVQNRLEPSYEGILHAFYKIYHQEGLLALYRGVSPAILGKIMLGKEKITLLHMNYCSYVTHSFAPLISKPNSNVLLYKICRITRHNNTSYLCCSFIASNANQVRGIIWTVKCSPKYSFPSCVGDLVVLGCKISTI